jgi:hypothetical protein
VNRRCGIEPDDINWYVDNCDVALLDDDWEDVPPGQLLNVDGWVRDHMVQWLSGYITPEANAMDDPDSDDWRERQLCCPGGIPRQGLTLTIGRDTVI